MDGLIFGILLYSISKSRNFTDVCMVGAQTFLPPYKPWSVTFFNIAELYLRLLKTHHFQIWQFD